MTTVQNSAMKPATRTRPVIRGNWIRPYHTREQLDAAVAAARHDATACEVGGFPHSEMAREWLKATAYWVMAARTFGARDLLAVDYIEYIQMLRKALIAGAYMCRTQEIYSEFARYMPLDSVGLRQYHDLMNMAYESPIVANELRDKKTCARWASAAQAAVESVDSQWRNSDWSPDLREIVLNVRAKV